MRMPKMRTMRRNFKFVAILGLCGILLLRLYSNYTSRSVSLEKGDDIQQLQHQNRVNEPSDALILTYMRSGSTFVGKVLGFRDDTFYWYEPLWKPHTWEYLSDDGTWCNYGRPGCRNSSVNTTHSVKNTLNFLLDIYKCENLHQHRDRFSNIQGSRKFAGPTGDVYQKCNEASLSCKNCLRSKGKSSVECQKCTRLLPEMCFNITMDMCSASTHHVTKVLRMSAAHAQYLLERHDRLKVVHIFRDPRAVINSRLQVRWYYKKKTASNCTPASDARILCKRMDRDLSVAEHLKKLYPDRVRILQYEDLNDPQRLAEDLFTFLNMGMTKTSETLLKSLASLNPSAKKSFHPDSYRFNMAWKVIDSTTKECRGVIERLGLRVFENPSELVDTNLSLIVDTLPHRLVVT